MKFGETSLKFRSLIGNLYFNVGRKKGRIKEIKYMYQFWKSVFSGKKKPHKYRTFSINVKNNLGALKHFWEVDGNLEFATLYLNLNVFVHFIVYKHALLLFCTHTRSCSPCQSWSRWLFIFYSFVFLFQLSCDYCFFPAITSFTLQGFHRVWCSCVSFNDQKEKRSSTWNVVTVSMSVVDLYLLHKTPALQINPWIMMRHVSCILLLEWSTTSQRLWVYRISVPYAQKDPRFLFEKRRGQPREFWSLVSTTDGSTLPQDCVEEQLC